jgi:dipeptidyl-peptidase-4
VAGSFPHQFARTRGFNLGSPRSFAVGSDGARVAFLRTAAGDAPSASLWVYDVAEDRERVVFDPAGDPQERITDEERDRRERTGEKQTGVVAFASDPALTLAAFVVGERLLVADLVGDDVRALATPGPAFDPRPDPTGRRVAYVTGGALHVFDLATGDDVELAADPEPDVHWGLAEFIAAEEMGRLRGYWWSPDGERVLAARVDERAVRTWYVTSPVDPAAAPRAVRYPQAGTANSDVSLHVVDIEAARVDVGWDRLRFEYVASVDWPAEGTPLALVQSRDQRHLRVLAIDVATGDSTVIREEHDVMWTSLVPGVPARLPDGRLLTGAVRDDTVSLLLDEEVATPPGLQVASVVDVGETVTFTGTQEPTEMHGWRLDPRDGIITRLTHAAGVHDVVAGGGLMVVTSETADSPLPVAVLRKADEPIHSFASFAETPSLTASPTFVSLGRSDLRTAVFTPGGVEPDHPLPVLLDPYGGPGHRRVVRASRAHLEAQWFADQGFVVLVADGRGTPYRGAAWERSVSGDYFDPALEDQVEALHAAAERFIFIDLTRVAMRGWSYGGGLVLAALLRRPEVFRAGIAGAPVTDMRLYDTHYTERYLGTPAAQPDAYERADVVKDAAALRGELMLVHGIADDNVYVAHSLRMSKALMEQGRRHTMIPLSGITHRPTDAAAAEHMLNIEVDFLRRALDVAPPKIADTPR